MSNWQDQHAVAGAYGDDPGAYGVPRRRRRWGRRVLMAFLGLLLLLVAVYFYLDFRLNRVSALADYSSRPGDTPGTNWLVVGSDSRQGLSAEQRKKYKTGKDVGSRTDSMMLLHTGSHGATLVSLPRDLYVPIPGHDPNKLNAAFAFGGSKLLVRTVEQFTKIHIDHYAEIGFGGFVGMVDAVGGVNMCIPQDMKDKNSGLNLKKGCQTLKGGQALGYVRARHVYANEDLGRVQAQRKFLAALSHKATSPSTMVNPFRMIPFILSATDAFKVDHGDHLYNVLAFAWSMRGLTGGNGRTITVPIGGQGSSPAVGSYITADTVRAGRLFRQLRADEPVTGV